MKRPSQSSKVDRAERSKIRKVGRIVCDAPRKVYSCIVLDISDTGARLLVHNKVPDTFALYVNSKRTLRDAVVVRRGSDTLGVRFTSEPVVISPSDKQMADLSN